MMELQQALAGRRSIRGYEPQKPVEKEKIQQVLEAAILAPSWKNSQTSRYHVVMGQEMVEKVKMQLPAFNQKNAKDAPVLLVHTFVRGISGFQPDGTPTNELGDGWGIYDAGLSCQNLLLKAYELGLGTLVMGIRDQEEIRNLLHIPQEETVLAVIALGYPALDPKQPPRKELSQIATFYE